MKFCACFLMVTLGSICSAGEIEELHKKLVGDESGKQVEREQDENGELKHGVTEIGLERTMCFGTCPAYTVVIKADGTFRYHGERYTQRTGDFTGRVNVYDFSRLAQFMKESEYLKLENTYSVGATDLPTVYTTVVMDGKRKVISDYGMAGPMKLWAIEELIDKMLLKADWDGEKKAPSTAPTMRPATRH